LADQFGVSKTALIRHKSKHIPERLARATEAAEVAQANTILADVCKLQERAQSILDTAENDGDLKTSLAAIRELRNIIELLAKLSGELETRSTVDIYLTTEYVQLQGTIVEALRPYPDARVAVANALQGLSSAGS